MSRRDWSLFLADMQEAIEKIERYTSAMTWEDFQPAAIKEQRDDIDWIAINGLRNRIAHEYFGLSLSVIWAIVQNDLPILARQLASWRDATG
ncbi:MAG: DUF86 domain-containing protein [Synechococcaceae cyanobacterium]|jgi:uncharacterized protein with HEPN domain